MAHLLVAEKKLKTEFLTSEIVEHAIDEPGAGSPRVQKWQRSRVIGNGRRGQVWQEIETSIKKKRACKSIDTGLFAGWQQVVETLARVSKFGRLDLFVDFYGWYDDGQSSVYLAVEYFKEQNIQKCFSAPLSEANVKSIARQLLEGLQLMHAADILHGDLRPATVYVDSTKPENWKVKISNWGLAKLLRDETQFGLFDLSEDMSYQPPETLNISKKNSGKATMQLSKSIDIWSLGTILWQLLVGQRLFPDTISLRNYVQSQEEIPDDLLQAQGAGNNCIAFLHALLQVDPRDRLDASAALNHAWFNETEPTNLQSEKTGPVAIKSASDAPNNDVSSFVAQNLPYDPNYVDGATICEDKIVRLLVLGCWKNNFPDSLRGGRMDKPVTEDEADELATRYLGQLKELASNDKTNYRDTHLRLLLFCLAASENNELLARVLLQGRYPVNPSSTLYGLRPLHFAAWMGSLEVAKLLVNECNVSVDIYSGQSASSTDKRKKTFFKEVMKSTYARQPYPRQPKSKDRSREQQYRRQLAMLHNWGRGYQPLHYAAARGRLSVVKLLLEAGAPIDTVDMQSMTPLMLSVSNRQGQVARYLILKQADMSFQNARKISAPSLAVQKGLTPIVLLMLEQGVKIEPYCALYTAITSGYSDLVSVLLRFGGEASINPTFPLDLSSARGPVLLPVAAQTDYETRGALEWHEQTPLYAAAQAGYTPITEILLQNQALPNLASANGDLPLLAAVKSGHTQTVELLLLNGAKPNMVPHPASPAGLLSSSTALSLAVLGGHTAIVRVLLHHGANANGAPGEPERPLLHAVRRGDLETTRVLLQEGGADTHFPLGLPAGRGGRSILRKSMSALRERKSAVSLKRHKSRGSTALARLKHYSVASGTVTGATAAARSGLGAGDAASEAERRSVAGDSTVSDAAEREEQGHSILQEAANLEQFEILQLLLQHHTAATATPAAQSAFAASAYASAQAAHPPLPTRPASTQQGVQAASDLAGATDGNGDRGGEGIFATQATALGGPGGPSASSGVGVGVSAGEGGSAGPSLWRAD